MEPGPRLHTLAPAPHAEAYDNLKHASGSLYGLCEQEAITAISLPALTGHVPGDITVDISYTMTSGSQHPEEDADHAHDSELSLPHWLHYLSREKTGPGAWSAVRTHSWNTSDPQEQRDSRCLEELLNDHILHLSRNSPDQADQHLVFSDIRFHQSTRDVSGTPHVTLEATHERLLTAYGCAIDTHTGVTVVVLKSSFPDDVAQRIRWGIERISIEGLLAI